MAKIEILFPNSGGGGSIPDHNNLNGLQGLGDDYIHLNQEEYNKFLELPDNYDFIPLSGTEIDKPITGDLEVENDYDSFWNLKQENETYGYSSFTFTDTGDILLQRQNTDGTTSYLTLNSYGLNLNLINDDIGMSTNFTVSNSGEIALSTNNPESKGITGTALYDKQNDPNAFAQIGDLTGGSVTSVTGVVGEITVSNGTTTPVIGINNAYTVDRDAYADAKIATTITDGVTTSAPNQNAIFNALALKENALTGTGILFSNAGVKSYISGSNVLYVRPDGSTANFTTTVRATSLAGLPAGSNTPITTSNTILSGLADLQAQVNAKANDTDVLKTTGNQTKSGVLTLNDSPIVPTATLPTQAVPLGQVEGLVRNNVLVLDNQSKTDITGTSTTTVASYVIPANTIPNNCILRVTVRFSKTGTNGTMATSLGFNASPGIDILINSASSGLASNKYMQVTRLINVRNGFIRGFGISGNFPTDYMTNGSEISSFSLDLTSAQTLYLTASQSNALDITQFDYLLIEIIN